MKLIFEECKTPGYAARTLQNILETDATLMIYIDENTSGEKLTKKLCIKHNKPYFEFDYKKSNSEIIYLIDKFKKWADKYSKLNVAGNGIYTWNKYNSFFNQSKINMIIDLILSALKKENLMIFSGGQSGTDEAAIHFAIQNNIPARIVAPKNWSFRLKDNKDIYDEKRFKERFE